MLFKLTGTNDLSKDDIKKLEANGFNMQFEQIDEEKTELYNTSYRISMYYNLFININTLGDLILIRDLLGYEIIIYNDSKNCCSLEIYNGYRE